MLDIDARIQFVPDHLAVVPPAPRTADDPDGDDRRRAFRNWYEAIYRFRVQKHADLANIPDLIPLELHRCANDFAYWLTIYGTIFEPRNDRTNLGGGDLPFIPFAKQVELARFLLWTLTQKGPESDAAVSKTRDVGASWVVCALAMWGWLFKSPWNVLLISRKEDLVDSRNQRSLFSKIDRLFWGLPDWMKPAGYMPDYHRQKLFLYNPANGNEIGGESTTSKSGRGDRATWAAFDEAAFIPELFNSWNGISSTTSHRWAISTENLDDGPDFYNLRTGNDMAFRPALFELDWWDNPLNPADYAENERQRMASRPSDFEREIMRNPHSASALVYAQFHDPKYEPDPQYNTPRIDRPTYITCDPGKLDDTAFVVIQEDPVTLETIVIDSYQNKGKDADFYGTLLSATPDEDKFPGYYGPKEHAFMDLIRELPGPTYCGDVYGDTSNAATLETFYSVIGKYTNPQGERIYINRDRSGNKDKGMYRKARSTFLGRQQCVHELSYGMRFATTTGAQFALSCLRAHRNKPQDRPMMTEPATPLHDWTSHVVQAIEFWGVYKKTRGDVRASNQKAAKKPHGHAMVAQLRTPGVARRRATLYRPPVRT